jgi:hypothetical protein
MWNELKDLAEKYTTFVCGDGEGEDTVTDFNEAEGDIATPDCENV